MTNPNFISLQIEKYKVFLYAGPNGNALADACISLTVQDAFVFLRFFRHDREIPANVASQHSNGNEMFYLNYSYDQLEPMINILQNEEPLTFFFNYANLIGYVATESELVGEAEYPI